MGKCPLVNGDGQMRELPLSWRRSPYRSLHILLLSLTSALQVQGILQGGGQGEFALVAESAREVIQIDGPDHGASKVVLLQPVSLW